MDKGTKHVFSNSSRTDAGQGPKNGTPDPPDNSIPRIMSGQESQPLGHTVPVCPLLEEPSPFAKPSQMHRRAFFEKVLLSKDICNQRPVTVRTGIYAILICKKVVGC